jgi:hypothetical protein
MKRTDQNGQALIELIIFLPLMFMVYSMIGGFASAINGSINQQKITRAYFYYLTQGNSLAPGPDSKGQVHNSWQQFGMSFVGWREKFVSGDNPTMPCYKINVPLKAAPTDKCDEPYSTETSLFIRVGTAYGICGATFRNESGSTLWLPNSPNANYSNVVDISSCTIQ